MIEFYNVRKKKKESVYESAVEIVQYKSITKTGKTVIRYGFRALDDDKTTLTKFVSKDTYDKLDDR